MSNDLLRQIRDAAVESSTALTDLLRRCAILARELDNDEFANWVTAELNGYSPDAELPSYRVLKAPAVGHFVGVAGSALNNFVIPPGAVPEKFRHFTETLFIRQPISFCVAMAGTDQNKGTLEAPWPGNLLALVGRQIVDGMQLISAAQPIAHGELAGIVDAVRNRVLEFVLSVEKAAPSDSGAPDVSKVPAREVSQLFQTIIVGNVGNVASASSGTTQVSLTVTPGDIESLKQLLRGLDVPAKEIEELEKSLAEDAGQPGLGAKTTAWLSNLAKKSWAAAGKVGGGVATAVVVKGILQYLGLG